MAQNTPSNTFALTLKEFRQQVETELDGPITCLELPALLILGDLCLFLKAETKEVLGEQAAWKLRRIIG